MRGARRRPTSGAPSSTATRSVRSSARSSRAVSGTGELLTEIRTFTRRAQDWATVGVATLVRRENGGVADARIALTNMGATPLRAEAAEKALLAGEADPAERMAEGTDPPADTGSSSEFRAHLARVVGRRALEEAMLR